MRRSDVKGSLDRLNNLRPHQCLYGMADGIEAQGQDEGFILNPASNGAIRVDGLTEGSVACCFINQSTKEDIRALGNLMRVQGC
jgi:hypothetical protein